MNSFINEINSASKAGDNISVLEAQRNYLVFLLGNEKDVDSIIKLSSAIVQVTKELIKAQGGREFLDEDQLSIGEVSLEDVSGD